jgi:formylglycine-generating enzyme required for sulfatase activity
MGSEYGSAVQSAPYTQRVTLSGYWIYQYQVTVAQYREFCAAKSYSLPLFPSGYSWKGLTDWAAPALQQMPIVNVSWDDAKAYATWAGVQLPTEAQYEYAACGSRGNNYPWGGTAMADDPFNGWDRTKCANYANSYAVGKSTWPVGSFPAGCSWCGVDDLAGNAWEWCEDWYGDYSTIPLINPHGPTSGIVHVLRGGSWYSDDVEGNHRGASRRSCGIIDYNTHDVGFRCVSNAPAL